MKKIIILLAIITLSISCKKKQDDPQPVNNTGTNTTPTLNTSNTVNYSILISPRATGQYVSSISANKVFLNGLSQVTTYTQENNSSTFNPLTRFSAGTLVTVTSDIIECDLTIKRNGVEIYYNRYTEPFTYSFTTN